MPEPLRLPALRAAALLLADAAEQMPCQPVVVQTTDGIHTVRICIEPVRYSLPDPAGRGGQAGQAAPPVLLVDGETADLVRAALRAAEHPLKMSVLARRCDRFPPTSHFRGVVHRMVEAGEVLHLRRPDRYWLAARPMPGQGAAAGAG